MLWVHANEKPEPPSQCAPLQKGKERQGAKDGVSELEMEPHTLERRPMNVAQTEKETFHT